MATFLADRDISTAIHYPYLLGEMPGLRLRPGVPVPVAAGVRDRVLSLPCYPELSDDEVGRVITALEGWSDG
jgi:dTDP-4-amino-4,6-dideoxygalactose transaminase